jgi:predicted RNA-binding Zn-ribbon protein involved in translation (DUF1610 family)
VAKLNGEIPANVNVTSDLVESWEGTEFPCPLCGEGLPIRSTKRRKPYCVCYECGVQFFIRGKKGIARLIQLAKDGVLYSATKQRASHAINLYNRLQQLKLQKAGFERKRPVFKRDENLENAISTLAQEISGVEAELKDLSRQVELEKKP